MPRYFILQLLKTKKKIFKTARRKQCITYKIIPIWTMASFSFATMKGHDLFFLLYFIFKLSQISLTEGLKSIIPCPSRPGSKPVYWIPAKFHVFRHKPGGKGGSNRSDLPKVTQLGVRDCPSQDWPWVFWILEVALLLSAVLGGIEVWSQGSNLPPSSTQHQ